MQNKILNVELITKYIKENNLSVSLFCKLCEISHTSFKRVMENKNVNLRIIVKICLATKILPSKLINI